MDVLGEQVQSGSTPWTGVRKTTQEIALDLLRQDTLGEYEIVGELGRGGMATVFLAHDLALDRKVAIKVMSTPLADEGMSERFRREARTAASLTHPHIIPIYAVRDRNPLLFFVMKFIMGQSLDPILKTMGRLPIPMVELILAQTASALGYAHRRGVIHRDVKPANIMLDEEGWAVVTDFGIAKVSTATGLTMTGVTVGTPAYMSPEQCLGREVTGASDQYSLGVVAYEMLTGRKPFVANTAMAMMYSHLNDPPTPLTDLRPDCPPGLAASVMRLLAKDPAERWPRIDDAFVMPTLAHDDPTRQELVALAMSGSNARMTARLSVPTSPVPPARRGLPPHPTPPDLTTVPMARAAGAQATPPSGTMPVAATPGSTSPSVRVPVSSRPPRTQIRWLPWAGLAAAIMAGLAIGLLRRPAATDGLSGAVPAVDSVAVPAAGEGSGGQPPAPVEPKPDSASIRTAEPDAASRPIAVSRVQLAPARVALEVGRTARLSLTLRGSDGRPLTDERQVDWSSSASAVAAIRGDGTVRGIAAGRATITARVEGKSASAAVEVRPAPTPVARPAPVASITVVPGSGTVPVGGRLVLDAELRDAGGALLTGREVTWSGSGRILSVSSLGEVTGVSPGSATVTAASEGRTAVVVITVVPPPVATVALNAPATPLRPGDTFQFDATLRDARGAVLTGRDISWESSDPAVATVANGLVTARAQGTATITATSEGRAVTSRISVGPPPPDPAVERARAIQEIGRLLDGFVAALNSRDLNQLKRVYPGMSPSETSSWKGLLEEKTLTRLQASQQQTQPPKLAEDGAEAQFQLRLTLQFSGRPEERSEISYRAEFQKENGVWRLSRLLQL